jgi:hypothetical protein
MAQYALTDRQKEFLSELATKFEQGMGAVLVLIRGDDQILGAFPMGGKENIDAPVPEEDDLYDYTQTGLMKVLKLDRYGFPERVQFNKQLVIDAIKNDFEVHPYLVGRGTEMRARSTTGSPSQVKVEITQKSALIFLSYARADVAQVQELYEKLAEAGYKPWMDTKNIIGGENWQLAINRAIENADVFVAVQSSNSVNKRGAIQLELRKALEKFQEKLESDIFIIPLIIDECNIPNELKKFHWIDYRKKDGWARLTQAIQESIKRASGQQD